MTGRSVAARRTGIVAGLALLAVAVATGVVSASNIASGLTQSRGDVSVPTWLYLATGAGVVGVSALLTMLVTDREFLAHAHDQHVGLSNRTFARAASIIGGTIGVGVLLGMVVVGIIGPQGIGLTSATVLLSFVVVRAILTTVAYTVGDPWPTLNPWRRIVSVLPTLDRAYPSSLGSWPAVGALLVFVWLEVVAPVISSPRLLTTIILVYSVLTVAGAVAFGSSTWFERGDPLSVWFRLYGSVAPIQRTDDGLSLRWPGARLSDDDVVTDLSVVGFVLVLVWELTFSGFIVTPPGVAAIEALVWIGLPPQLVYLLLLVGGYALCWWVYWTAAGLTRSRAETYLSRRYIAIRYAPPLLAIAAGYHFAHYIGFSISLWPALLEALSAPLNPGANPTQLALTSWFGYVEIAGILVGHVLAVWIAHAVSIELFPGKLQAIRSQYPFIVVMIVFTMISLYLVSLPTLSAPFVPA
ncbi:hypothetical protein [Natronosalvus rutilus]|uniref:Uncharacterized protein n=1 Tax=Natronosalvus rutilus TaxID=2953753 RepID=A0A9E7SWA5_9EURY|nr:hypothetical protein [Natronosalvus rutilus]UTF55315.1 hypothetical protein NGM29_08720 [Natronosalvus rutilus]